MRVLLVLFGLGASASAAVALHEVRAETAHRDEIAHAQPPTRYEAAAPRPLPSAAPLPFGGVPREPIDVPPPVSAPVAAITGEADDDSHEQILDVEDRCPDEPETVNGINDIDGCPDVSGEIANKVAIEITPTIEVYDGPAPQRRVIRLDSIIY
jgi:hypothetical protein